MNKDPGLLLTWLPIDGHELDFKFNFSRQGNRYAGGIPQVGMCRPMWMTKT